MTGNATLDAIIAVIGALATAWGLWAGGRKALADARALKAPPVTPYEALAQRVADLEVSDAKKGKEISRLRGQVDRLYGVLSREVVLILNWIDSGSSPPPPDRETRVVKEVIDELSKETTR